MRRLRFRIGSLLILIVFLGVGFAALREATDFWDSIVLTLAIGVLLVSLLLAIHRKVERRAFWVAFALFGWVYLGLTAIPPIESRLLTTKVLTYLDSQVPGRPVLIEGSMLGAGNMDPIALTVRTVGSVAFSPDGSVLASSNNSGNVRAWGVATGRLIWSANGTIENFVRIGHSLFALLLAWLGGSLSRRLNLRSRRADPVSPSVEASGVALMRTIDLQAYGRPDYARRGSVLTPGATRWPYERGVRVMGIDAWGRDGPLDIRAREAMGGLTWPPRIISESDDAGRSASRLRPGRLR